VIKEYGKPKKEGELDFAPIPSKWISYEGIGFDFVTETGRIITINIHSD
jgi:hypothetical protein